MISFEVNGEAVSEEQVKTGSLVIEQGRYRPALGNRQAVFVIELGPAMSPRPIEFTFTEGPEKGKSLKGIYELNGDRLTICRGLTPDNVRPTEFATGAESGSALVVWKRAKSAEGGKDTRIKEELARFQGTWQLVSAESDGEPAPEERVRQIRVTIQGNTHTVRFGDRVIAHDVSFEIDPAQSPKQVTDTINDGPDTGKRFLGIYALEGDRLTSCVAPVGKARPTEFASRPGSGHTLRVFRRVGDTAKD